MCCSNTDCPFALLSFGAYRDCGQAGSPLAQNRHACRIGHGEAMIQPQRLQHALQLLRHSDSRSAQFMSLVCKYVYTGLESLANKLICHPFVFATAQQSAWVSWQILPSKLRLMHRPAHTAPVLGGSRCQRRGSVEHTRRPRQSRLLLRGVTAKRCMSHPQGSSGWEQQELDGLYTRLHRFSGGRYGQCCAGCVIYAKESLC